MAIQDYQDPNTGQPTIDPSQGYNPNTGYTYHPAWTPTSATSRGQPVPFSQGTFTYAPQTYNPTTGQYTTIDPKTNQPVVTATVDPTTGKPNQPMANPPGSTTSGTTGMSVNPDQWTQFTADLGVGSDTDHTQINTLMQRLQQAGYQVSPGPIDSMGRQDSLIINGKLTRVFDSSGKWVQTQDNNGSAWGGSGGNNALSNLSYGLGAGGWTAPWTGQWQAPTADQALNSPGVQFALQNTLRAMENNAAATGVLGNARAQEAISQDLGQQLLGNYQQIYNQALQSYQQQQSDFFANQDRPFQKYMQEAGLGSSTAVQG